MTDPVDQALADLADFAWDAWSNKEIVKRIEAVRALHRAQQAVAESSAKHAKAMRDEACLLLGITPGAMIKSPKIEPVPSVFA